MAWNLNNKSNEYRLSGKLSSEMIDIYGLNVTYIKTEKANPDLVLGEFTHLRADNSSVFHVNVYPENTAGFDNNNDILSKFGILNFDSVNLFISSIRYNEIYPDEDYQKGHGDLIALPSGKVFEITDIESQVMGLNNMYTYKNQKNVFMLKCKPFNYNRDEIAVDDINFESLDTMFDIQETYAEKTAVEEQSTLLNNVDEVFGSLG
jgi:hypothetical protein